MSQKFFLEKAVTNRLTKEGYPKLSVTFIILIGLRTHLFHISFPQIPKDTHTCSCRVRTVECTFLHFRTGSLNMESVSGEQSYNDIILRTSSSKKGTRS